MVSALGFVAGGLLQGTGQGMLEQYKQNREQALREWTEQQAQNRQQAGFTHDTAMESQKEAFEGVQTEKKIGSDQDIAQLQVTGHAATTDEEVKSREKIAKMETDVRQLEAEGRLAEAKAAQQDLNQYRRDIIQTKNDALRDKEGDQSGGYSIAEQRLLQRAEAAGGKTTILPADPKKTAEFLVRSGRPDLAHDYDATVKVDDKVNYRGAPAKPAAASGFGGKSKADADVDADLGASPSTPAGGAAPAAAAPAPAPAPAQADTTAAPASAAPGDQSQAAGPSTKAPPPKPTAYPDSVWSDKVSAYVVKRNGQWYKVQ